MTYVYIIKRDDGKFYVGMTADVGRRWREHVSGKGAKYFSTRRPVGIALVGDFATMEDARWCERRVKRMSREEKERLYRSQICV